MGMHEKYVKFMDYMQRDIRHSRETDDAEFAERLQQNAGSWNEEQFTAWYNSRSWRQRRFVNRHYIYTAYEDEQRRIQAHINKKPSWYTKMKVSWHVQRYARKLEREKAAGKVTT